MSNPDSRQANTKLELPTRGTVRIMEKLVPPGEEDTGPSSHFFTIDLGAMWMRCTGRERTEVKTVLEEIHYSYFDVGPSSDFEMAENRL